MEKVNMNIQYLSDLFKEGKYNICNYIYLFLIGLLMTSCTSESFVKQDVTEPGEKNVIFSINVPYSSIGQQTRAIEEGDENNVKTINVFAYKIAENGEETFEYSAIGELKDGTTGSSKKTFDVTVKIAEYDQRFVVIANAEDAVQALLNQRQSWKGVAKNDMLSLLEFGYDTDGEKWDVEDPTNFTAFPMWGESKKERITITTTGLSNSISLLRMVSKINVLLDETVPGLVDIDGTGKFKMSSVYLYNTNIKGKIVPEKDALTTQTVDNKEKISVSKPSIPSDIADPSKRYKGPLKYTDFSAPGKEGIAMLGAIYTFETEGCALNEGSKATCLVVGGHYMQDQNETFYRVDFINSEATPKKIWDFLRNHLYTVKIVNVRAKGHNTPDDAFNSKLTNMDIEILSWDEGEIGNWKFGEQYKLGVSDTKYELGRSAKTRILQRVITDSPNGWSAVLKNSAEEEPSWIRITDRTNNGVNKIDDLHFDVDANTTGGSREAYMYISAENFTIKVTITQAITDEFSLVVEPEIENLDFSSGLSTIYPLINGNFDVTWSPADQKVNWIINEVNNGGINFGTSPTSGELEGGIGGILVQPVQFNQTEVDPQLGDPFLSKVSRLEITLENELGQFKNKLIYLRQTNYTAVPEQDPAYPLDGATYSFIVKCNTPWKAELIGSPVTPSIANLINDSGEGNTTIGEGLSFKAYLGAENDITGQSDLKISSLEGKFDDVTVRINGSIYFFDGEQKYLPSLEDAGPVIFDEAAGVCPQGYILPTRSIMTAWVASKVPNPEPGDYWINETGYYFGGKTEYELEVEGAKTLTAQRGATRFNNANTGKKQFTPVHYKDELYIGQKGSKIKMKFENPKNGYLTRTEYEPEGKFTIEEKLVEPEVLSKVRCVKPIY